MPYCVFKDCKNSSQKQKSHDGISFHRFPLDANLRKCWVSIIRENRKDTTWTASKFCVICSVHFKKEDIYLRGKKGHRCLKKQAKPVLEQKSSEIIFPELISEVSGPSEERKCEDDDNLDDVKDSDLDSSTFETPRKHQLRKELRRQQLLRSTTKKKVALLQQKVRRLKKRNSSLKIILKELFARHSSDCKCHLPMIPE